MKEDHCGHDEEILPETCVFKRDANSGKDRETKELLSGKFCIYKQRILLMGLSLAKYPYSGSCYL